MRIIGGTFRGKKLNWLADEKTRPTPDRVKENIFNILAARGVVFPQIGTVLDLFSGTGQMGLECLSRGAKNVVLNDPRPESQKIIGANLKSLPAASFSISCADYLKCLGAHKSQKFSLIFLDPPFANPDFISNSVAFIRANKMLAPDGFIIIEAENPNLAFPDFAVDSRKYGRETIYILNNIINQG